MQPNNDAQYCFELAASHDRERLLCALMAPADRQPALVALLAWNHEIAKVSEVVSEEMVGLIRYQWWRDALQEIYDGKTPRQHAVVQELARAIATYGLPQKDFEAVIDAREVDLQEAPFSTAEALNAYAAETAGGLAGLWLRVLGGEEAAAARHVWAAWALVGVVRSVHFHAHQGRVLLPGIAAQTFLQQGVDNDVLRAVHAIHDMAHVHLSAAKRAGHEKAAKPVVLLGVLANDYLKRIKAAEYNPLDARIEAGRATRALKLLLRRLF